MLTNELSAYFLNYIYIINYEKLVPKIRKFKKNEKYELAPVVFDIFSGIF